MRDTANGRAGQRRGVLSAMTPGTLYRTHDLVRLTNHQGALSLLVTRLANLQRQGRIVHEARETRSGTLVLWRLP